MNGRRRTAAVIAGVLLACLAAFVIVRLTSRAGSSAHATGPLPAERARMAVGAGEAELSGSSTGEPVGTGRTANGGAPELAREERIEDDATDRSDDSLGDLLARMRAKADRDDFHVSAWPLVLGMSGLLAGSDPASKERADRARAVTFDDGEHERVRSACAVAAALARCEVAAAIADELAWAASHEVQRGAWLARGLSSTGDAGLAIDLRRFESRLPTFPVAVTRTATEALVLEAFERTERLMPVGAEEFSEGEIAARREESFTRQVAALSVLGPAVRRPGSVRDRMLSWLEEPTREAAAVRPAALHCLALAARDDDALARQLVAIANAHLFERGGTQILEVLANLAGRDDLVLSALVDFFRNADAMQEPRRTLAHANALVALEGVLASRDEEVRQQALAVAMERILDPRTGELDRSLFLAMLSGTEAGSGVLFDALTLAAATGDPNELALDLSLIGAAPAEQKPAAHAFLVQLLGNPGTSAELRRSIYTQIAQIAAPGALDVLRGQLAVETDPGIRDLLERLEAKLLGG